jgi:hypothetical protein
MIIKELKFLEVRNNATDYGLGGPGIESRWGRDFPPVQTGPRACTASCTTGTGSFPGGKGRPGRAADHLPPSSADVLEEYSYTSTPLWATTEPVMGLLYLYRNNNTRSDSLYEDRQVPVKSWSIFNLSETGCRACKVRANVDAAVRGRIFERALSRK